MSRREELNELHCGATHFLLFLSDSRAQLPSSVSVCIDNMSNYYEAKVSIWPTVS